MGRDAAVGGDLLELRFDFRRVVGKRVRGEDDLRKIDRHDRQPGRLQQLLAEAHRLECARARADRADARVFEAAHDAADPTNRSRSAANSSPSTSQVWLVVSVKRDAILIEVVGDRKFAAKSVAAAVDVDFVDLVVARLKQDRNVEPRLVDEFQDRDLVAEIRQANDQAVDRVALLAKMPA